MFSVTTINLQISLTQASLYFINSYEGCQQWFPVNQHETMNLIRGNLSTVSKQVQRVDHDAIDKTGGPAPFDGGPIRRHPGVDRKTLRFGP